MRINDKLTKRKKFHACRFNPQDNAISLSKLSRNAAEFNHQAASLAQPSTESLASHVSASSKSSTGLKQGLSKFGSSTKNMLRNFHMTPSTFGKSGSALKSAASSMSSSASSSMSHLSDSAYHGTSSMADNGKRLFGRSEESIASSHFGKAGTKLSEGLETGNIKQVQQGVYHGAQGAMIGGQVALNTGKGLLQSANNAIQKKYESGSFFG